MATDLCAVIGGIVSVPLCAMPARGRLAVFDLHTYPLRQIEFTLNPETFDEFRGILKSQNGKYHYRMHPKRRQAHLTRGMEVMMVQTGYNRKREVELVGTAYKHVPTA